MGRELTLKKALRTVSAKFDLVLIDCPPALGLLTVNALVASDFALLSAEAQYFAMQGVEQALGAVHLPHALRAVDRHQADPVQPVEAACPLDHDGGSSAESSCGA